MIHTTVRISGETRDVLRELAQREGRSMQAVLESALQVYQRQVLLEVINAGFERVREEEAQYQSNLAQSLDGTLADGLPDEQWTDDGEVQTK